MVKLAILIVLVATALAVPMRREASEQCAKTCYEDLSKFKYETGKTYEFNYEAETNTQLQGSETEMTSLAIKATADVEVLGKCEMVLRLRDVSLQQSTPGGRLTTSEGNREFARLLEAEPLRFGFNDGKIEDVCPTAEEDKMALNIKRGILSAFQNNMDDFKKPKTVKETDIAGNCDTEYSVEGTGWGSVDIKKSKNILGCTDRHDYVSSLQAADYRVPSEIQTMPLMKSWSTCTQHVHTAGHLGKAICTEEHVFRPFSKQKNGAITTTKMTLSHSRSRSGIREEPRIDRQTDLLMEHQCTAEPRATRDTASAKNTLSEICSKTLKDIRPETPRLFAKLVYDLRDLNTQGLHSVYLSMSSLCRENTEQARKFFVDAMVAVGSTSSVQVMRDLISSKKVTGLEAEMWLTSLAFIQKPTKEMIGAVFNMLSDSKASRKVFLSISTLTHSYCRINSECMEEKEVQRVFQALERAIGFDCKGDSDKVVMGLKALGNIGLYDRVIPNLNRCIRDKSLSMEVRLAAVDAFRRMPCGFDRSDLLKTFTTSEEETEMRIATYLQIMKCPTTRVIYTVKDTLEKEEVNQVGSFVWTHLTNLQESGSRYKRDIRKILEDEVLKREFNFDKRKFSRNYEKSFFVEYLNTGATAESNIIWSPKSFIPRSGMFNMTIDLFGKSINLLEVGGRIEGMEYLLENFFGPNGYFPENAVANVLSRNKRATSNRINQLHKAFGAKAEDEPKGNIYMRMFGNEIRYTDFVGFKALQEDKFNFLDVLMWLAKEHDIDYSKSMMFLDSTMCIPTFIGLPLKLAVNGTATINVKVGGKMDIRNIGTAPRSMDIDGHIKPSGAIEISSMMYMDAGVSKSGLKMVSTMHSSTAIEGKVQLKDGKIFTTSISMPRDKIEILDVSTKFFVVHNNAETEQEMIKTDRIEKSKCTGDMLKTVLGLEVCGTVAVPNALAKTEAPFFPMTGPVTVKVDLNKVDTLTAYQFETRFEMPKERKFNQMYTNYIAAMSFNTPGSRIDREIMTELELKTADKAMTIQMKSPWKRVSANGALLDRDDLKRFTATLNIDETKEYKMTSEVKIEKLPKKTRFTPSLELVIPGRDTITAEGLMEYHPAKKAQGSIKLLNIFKQPVTFKAEATQNKRAKTNKIAGSVELRSEILNFKTTGEADQKKAAVISKLDIEYTLKNKPTESMTFHTKARDLSGNDLVNYELDGAVSTTQWPDYNMQIEMNGKKSDKHISSNIDIRYGSDPSNKDRRIVLAGQFNDVSKKATKYDGKLSLQYPLKNMDYSVDFQHSQGPKVLNSRATIKYDVSKTIEGSLKLERELKGKLMYRGETELSYPGREMRLMADVDERTPGEFHSNMIAQWQRGQKVTMDSMYKTDGREHEVSSTLRAPRRPPVIVKGAVTIDRANPAGSASVQFNSKTYSTDVSLNLEQNRMSGEAAVKIPTRRIETEVHATRTGGKMHGDMSLKWDADRDSTKTFTMSGDYENRSDRKMVHHEASIGFTHPQKTAGIDIELHKAASDGKITLKTNWDKTNEVKLVGDYSDAPTYSGREIRSNIKLTTPFEGYRTMTTSVSQILKDQEYITHGEASWAPGKKIEGDFSLKHGNPLREIESSLVIATPFNPVEKIDLRLNHNLQNGQLNSNVKVEWDSKTIALTAKGTGRGLDSIDGEVSFSSPFEYFESMSIKAKHSVTRANIRSNIEGEWRRQSMGLDLDMQYRLNLPAVNTRGTLTLTTPFRSYPVNSLTWNHKNSESDIDSRAEAKWGDEQTLLSIKGKHMVSSKRSLNGEVQLQTSFKPVENIVMTLKHENGQMDFSTLAEVTSSQKKMLSIGGEFNNNNMRTLMGKFRLNTPVSFLRDIRASFNADTTKTPMTGHAEAQWTPKEKISVDGTFQNNDEKLAASVALETPFSRFPMFNAEFSHQAPGNGKYKSSGSVEYLPRQKISAEGELTMSASPTGKMMITTPFEQVRRLEGNFGLRGDMKRFQANGEVKHNGNNRFAVDTTFENDSTMKGSLTINTPFKPVEELKASFSHNGDLLNFKTSGDMTYDNDQTYGATVEFQGKRTVRASASVRTPIRNWRTSTAKFSHSGDASQFETLAEIELSHPKYDKFSAKLTHEFTRNLRTIAVLKTPFRNYEEMSAEVSHQGPAFNFETKAMIKTSLPKYREFSAEVTHRGSELTSFNTEASIMTSVSGWNKFSVEARNSGMMRDAKLTVATPISGYEKFALEGTNTENLENLKATLKVTLPFPYHREYSAEVTNKGGLENFQASATLNTPIRNWNRLGAQIKFRGSQPTDWEVSTTLFGKDSATIELTHKGEWKDFRSAGKLETPFQGYERFTGELNNQIRGTNVQSSLKVTTPFNKYENVEFSIDHRGDLRRMQSTASAKRNNEEFSVDIDHRFAPTNVRSKVSLKTPIRHMEEQSLEVRHTGDLYNFKSSALLKTSSPKIGEISGEIFYDGKPSKFNTGLTFKSPFSTRPVVLSVNHNGESLTKFITKAELEGVYQASQNVQVQFDKDSNVFRLKLSIPEGKLDQIQITHNGPLNDFTTAGTAKTGFFDDLAFRVKHIGHLKNFQTSASVSIPQEQNIKVVFNLKRNMLRVTGRMPAIKVDKLNINHEGPITDFKTSATVNTPIKGYRNVGFNLEHTGDLNAFTTKGNMRGQSFEARWNKRIPSLSATIELPVLKLNKIELNHNGGPKDFTSTATIDASYKNFKKFESRLEHKGDLDAFTTKAKAQGQEMEMIWDKNSPSLKINGKIPMAKLNSIDIQHDGPLNRFTSQYAISTEFNGWRDLNGKLEHSGDINAFNTKASSGNQEMGITWNKGRSYLKVEGKLPLTKVRSFSLEHAGPLRKFTTTANADTDFKFGNVDASLEHSGTLDVFNTKAAVMNHKMEVSWDKNTPSLKIEGELPMVKVNSFELSHAGPLSRFSTSGRASTDFKGYRNMNFNFDHAGSLNRFTTKGALNVPRYPHSFELNFNGKPTKFETSGIMKTPYRNFENMEFNVNHNGDADAFRSKVELKTPEAQSTELTWNKARKYIKLQSSMPSIKLTNLELTHEGGLSSFKTNGALRLNVRKYNDFSFETQHQADQSSMTATTPFRGFESNALTIQHSGSLNNFEHTHTLVSSHPAVGTVSVHLKHMNDDSGFKTEGDMKLPFQKVSSPAFAVEFKGQPTDFTTSAMVSTSYPGMDTFSGSYTHKGTLAKFNCNGNIKTPFRNFESQSIIISHEGDLSNFKSLVSAKTSYPRYETLAYRLEHNGNLNAFRTTGSVEYSSKKIEGTVDMRMHRWSNARGSLTFKSPFEYAEHLGLKFTNKFNSRIKKFSHTHTIMWSPRQKINTDIDYTFPGTGSLTVRTPFEFLREGIVNFDGSYSQGNMRYQTDVTHNSKRYFDGNFKYAAVAGKHSADLTVKTPFDHLRDGTLNLEGKFNPTDMSVKADASHNGKPYNGEFAFTSKDNSHHGELKMQTPFDLLRDGSIVFDAKSRTGDLALASSAIYNGQKYLDGEVTYKKNLRHAVALTLREPHPMTASVAIRVAPRQKSVEGDLALNWNTQQPRKEFKLHLDYNGRKDAMVKATLPERVISLSTSTSSNYHGLTHKSEFSWDEQRNRKVTLDVTRHGNNYNIKMTTPLRAVAVKAVKDTDSAHKVVEGELMWDADNDQGKKLSFKTEMDRLRDGAKVKTTVNHPSLRRPLVLTNTVRSTSAPMYSATTELEYSRDPNKKLTVSATIGNTGNNNYTVEVTATHPASRINIKLAGHAGANRESLSTGMNLKYQERTFFLINKINKLRKEIASSLQTSMPWMPDYNIVGKMEERYGNYHFEMENTYPNTRHGHPHVVKSTLDIRPSEPLFELKMIGSHNKVFVHTFAKYLNKSAVAFKLSHDLGEPVDDAEIMLYMKSSHLLYSKAFLRRQMWSDIKSVAEDYSENIKSKYQSMQNEQSTLPTLDLGDMLDSFKQEIKPAVNTLWRESRDFQKDYRYTKQALREMYNNNEFFLRDMADQYNEVAQTIERHLAILEQKYEQLQEEMIAKLEQMIVRWKNCLNEYNEKMMIWTRDMRLRAIEAYSNMLEEMESKSEQLYEKMMITYVTQLRKMRELVAPLYNEVAIMMAKIEQFTGSMREYHERMMDKVRSHPHYSKVMNAMQKVKSALLFNNNWRNNMRDMVGEVVHKYGDGLQDIAGQYAGKVDALKEKLLNHPRAQRVKALAQEYYGKAFEYYEYYKIEENVRHHVKQWVDSARLLAEKQWRDFMDNTLQINRTRVLTWEPRVALFEGELFIPLPMDNLKTLPELSMEPYMKKAKAYVNRYIPETDFNIMDLYYTYKPDSDINNWIPPFKTHAQLIGRQHLMTFDKRGIEFAGRCSYVLARDFVDGNFTVIVNYDKSRQANRKSITVISNDKEIEILPDLTVRVSNKKEELPLQFQNTTIRRHGNTIIITHAKGLKISCDEAHGICSVEMSGWYYGKTAGLLGTYDNEPSNDMLTSRRTVEDNVENFAYSWNVDTRCTAKDNLALEVRPDEGSRAFKACAKLFKDKKMSPFGLCFRQVEPTPYMRACINDASASRRVQPEDALCNVSAAYVQDCAKHGVPIKLPKKCVKCEVPRRTLYEGETHEINEKNKPEHSADVVFVIEDKQCNKKFNLKLATKTIDGALKKAGLKKNRYGLVGFGGEGVHDEEHQHTLKGELFGTAGDIESTSLTFKEDGENDDVVRAVQMAARYPFRLGVSKSIVLVPCSGCSQKTISYSVIQQKLLAMGIKLHIMMRHNFKLKSGKTKTNYLYGIDDSTAFTSKDMKGDNALYKQIAVPKDICVALAQETNGSIWNVHKLESGRWNDRKLFITAMSNRLARTANPLPCQKCECMADEYGVGMTVCNKCGVFDDGSIFDIPILPKGDDQFQLDFEEYMKSPKHKYSVRKA